MVTKLVVLIFASFFIQNEACTRILQRLQQLSRAQQPQRLRPTGQAPLPTTGKPNMPTTQTAPTTIFRPETDPSRTNLPGSSMPNVLQNSRSPYTRVIDDISPLNYENSPRSWIPDMTYSSTVNFRNPSDQNGPSSTWNTRQFNAAYRYPRTTQDQLKLSSDASTESPTTNASPRSLISMLPGMMNAGTGLLPSLVNPSSIGSSLSMIPSDVTRGVTSSLSNVTPSVTSTLSSIPNAVTSLSSGVTSALSPSNYFPSSTMSSIPGLIYLASSFANWMNSNSTLSSTRSNTSSYTFMSYIPGLLSVISVIAPFLSSFGSTSQPAQPNPRSPFSTITSLPTSLLGLSGLTSGGNNPYGYEKNSNGRDKSRMRPSEENQYYGDNFDDQYADERGDYKYDNQMDERYQHSRNKPSSTHRSQKSSAGHTKRGDRGRNQYNHEYEY